MSKNTKKQADEMTRLSYEKTTPGAIKNGKGEFFHFLTDTKTLAVVGNLIKGNVSSAPNEETRS
ncbi:MAG: hypothetical protein KAW56_14890 [Candidatus Marinimicrobia bacterium]|nr:hypothetical protein [Candidatus Neomarinimicrobiota bacterium]